MPTKRPGLDPLRVQIHSSYEQLASASQELNTVSNKLGTSISKVESALRRLNVGVPAWVTVKSGHSDDGLFYDLEEVGYDKIRKDWCLAIRIRSGHEGDPDGESFEMWPFNEAPRQLRIGAAGTLPRLLDELTKQAQKTTEEIRAKLDIANQFADLVLDASIPKKPTSRK